jgi:hypothetical protein
MTHGQSRASVRYTHDRFRTTKRSQVSIRGPHLHEALGGGPLARREMGGYFLSISASNPNTTALAALSSSRSISNSPKVRVSR